MKNTNNMEREETVVIVNSIEKETEKAVMLNCQVMWNGNTHGKSLWFPKSVLGNRGEANENGHFAQNVATWFCEKLSCQNQFHGYFMYFC